MSTPWLLTGVTSGLGAQVLKDMLGKNKYPPKDIIATSRSDSKRKEFESLGVQFRVLDYARPETLEPALKGVDNFFFVASPERDTPKRIVQHKAVIDAAKAAGVKRIWYNSLMFGGFNDDSKAVFQQAHYVTEDQLVESGVDFINLRAGIYPDAFPLYLNWYPSSKTVFLPKIDPPTSAAKIIFSSREELGEAHAALFAKGLDAFPSIKPQGRKNIILITGEIPNSLDDLVGAINRARDTDIPIKHLEPQAWIEEESTDDVGHKPKGWFQVKLVVLQGFSEGDAAVTDPAMKTLLGRTPESGAQTVERLLKADRDYTWHQNHDR